MIQRDEKAASGQLRILVEIAWSQHRVGWHAGPAQRRRGLEGVLTATPFGQRFAVQQFLERAALGCRFRAHGDETLLAGASEDAVGIEPRRALAQSLGHVAGRRIVEDQRFQKADAAFHLRQVDVLAEAGTSSMQQGAPQRRDAETWRDEIRVGTPRPAWRPVRPTHQREQTGNRRALAAEPGITPFRPGLTTHGRGEHY